MMPKPSGCTGCPLAHIGQGFCPDKIPAKSVYMLIGEAPGKNEITKAEPFVGRAGFVLDFWLIKTVPILQLAKERGQMGYMNTLRCLPPEVQGRAYPRGADKLAAEAHCRQYDRIPDSVEVMILLGESPQRAWFGPELDAEDASDRRLGHDLKGVMGRVGREYTKDGKRWVFAPHPAYVLRQPALVGSGQAALQIATGSDKIVEADYIEWGAAIEVLHQM